MTLPSGTILATAAVAACLPLAIAASAAQTCEGLAKLELPATSITTAESLPAGKFSAPSGKAMPDLPAFCRVAGILKPAPDSDIQLERQVPRRRQRRFRGRH